MNMQPPPDHAGAMPCKGVNALPVHGKPLAPPPGTRPSRPGRVPGGAGDGGFTLLEILVVIAILGLLVALVAPAALRQLGGAREKVTRQSIERLSGVLDLYRLDAGSYPTTEQGLAALNTRPAGVPGWNGPYLKGNGQALDPWNHEYPVP